MSGQWELDELSAGRKGERHARLGKERAPAILCSPESGSPRAIVVVLPGGGAAYDKQWAHRWLPLEDLPVLRAYVDLPLHGERMAEDLRERHRKHRVRRFHAPVILGMAEEMPSILDDLAALAPSASERVGILGWSLGGLAAFLSAMGGGIRSVGAFAIPSRREYLRAGEAPIDPRDLALLDRMDLHVRAAELHPTAILLLHGMKDEWVSVDSSRALHALLLRHYAAAPGRLRYVEYPDAAHDPCRSSLEDLEAIRQEVRAWLVRTLLD